MLASPFTLEPIDHVDTQPNRHSSREIVLSGYSLSRPAGETYPAIVTTNRIATEHPNHTEPDGRVMLLFGWALR